MDLTTPYAFGKTVDLPCAEAQLKVREELAKEGFGVLTEIDLSKIDEFGFTDLQPGADHGPGGWSDVGIVRVYANAVPR